MEQIKLENANPDLKKEDNNLVQSVIKEELPDRKVSRENAFFIQIMICSLMIMGILFIKYIQPNTIIEKRIEQELTKNITVKEVKQFICELEEMSDKYWRIK